jgi:hypothetical protein
MSLVRRLAVPMFLLGMAATASLAAPMDLDLGLRASIYDENYKLGLGGEIGAVVPVTALWDMGLHLNYSIFRSKIESLESTDEFGGYLAGYYKPSIDQAFSLRIGPHIGYAHIVDNYLDVGADLMAVFKIKPGMSFYTAFIPSFMIGENTQSLFRVGLGMEFGPAR